MIDFDHSCLNFKNLDSLISSLDLNSTPLGDVDRNGNGSAGAIGQHRQTTQRQRDPLVQNKHHDINADIGWQLFDPTLKYGKSSMFMNKIYILFQFCFRKHCCFCFVFFLSGLFGYCSKFSDDE